MNIQDAIRSGKPFRRKSWTGRDYFRDRDMGEYICYSFDVDSLASDDWEILEDPVSISRTDFYNAYGRALKKHGSGDLFNAEFIEMLWGEINNE